MATDKTIQFKYTLDADEMNSTISETTNNQKKLETATDKLNTSQKEQESIQKELNSSMEKVSISLKENATLTAQLANADKEQTNQLNKSIAENNTYIKSEKTKQQALKTDLTLSKQQVTENGKVVTSLTKEIAESNKLESQTEQLDNETKQLNTTNEESNSILGKLNSSYIAVAAGVTGFVVAMNNASSAVLTNSLNQAQLQSNLGATDEEMKQVNKTLDEQGKQYGFTSQEVARMSALNSDYVTTADGVSQANKLVAQTATLYALKEGDVSASAEQAVTAQEALRDVILTGSTTAFEDAGISLDGYSEAIIESTGFTDAQVESITANTNGTFEYTEALSKAATPQQRFNALSAVTDEKMQETADSMGIAGIAALQWQTTIVTLQNALLQLEKVLVIVVGVIVLFISTIIKAITQSFIFQTALNGITTILPTLIKLTIAVGTAVLIYQGYLLGTTIAQNIYNGSVERTIRLKIEEAIVWALANAPMLIFIGIIAIVIFTLLNYQKVLNAVITVMTILKNAFLTLLPIMITEATFVVGVLTTAWQTFGNYLLTVIIPTIISTAQSLITFLMPAMIAVSTFIFTQLLPAFITIGTYLLTTFGPLIVVISKLLGSLLVLAFQLVVAVIQILQPLVVALVQVFIALIPIIVAVATIIKNLLSIAFVILGAIIGTLVIPVLNFLINILTNVLIPIITRVANTIITVLNVAFNLLSILIQTVVIPVLNFLINILTNVLIPIISATANVITSVLNVAFNLLDALIQNVIIPILNTLTSIVKGVTKVIEKLADALNKALTTALNLVLIPIQAVIDIFQTLLDIIVNVTNAILDGLIGAFNSIPLVPDIDTSSEQQSLGVNSSGRAVNRGISNNTRNVTFNVHQTGQLSKIDVLRMQKGLI